MYAVAMRNRYVEKHKRFWLVVSLDVDAFFQDYQRIQRNRIIRSWSSDRRAKLWVTSETQRTHLFSYSADATTVVQICFFSCLSASDM
jgi:hypothetical protein